MPVKRTVQAMRPAMRLSDLTFHEKFALMASWWRPGTTIRSAQDLRFTTWAQFFEIYEQVRAELLAEHRHWPPFAELALPFFQRGADPADAVVTYDAAVDRYRTPISERGRT